MLKTPKRIRNHVNPLSSREETFFDGFENNNPIIMDIGSYRGEFGQKLVEKFGNKKNYIFTEIRKPFCNYLKELFEENIFDEKKEKESLLEKLTTNSLTKNAQKENAQSIVKVFGGNTAINMENILKSSIKRGVVVEKIFVNFPDPWFKKRQHKRRVVWGKFLDDLKKWLPAETEIVFQTDQKKLFFETLDEVKKRKFLEIERFRKPIWGITTYWEDMKVSEGDKIWRMKIRLKGKKGKSLSRRVSGGVFKVMDIVRYF